MVFYCKCLFMVDMSDMKYPVNLLTSFNTVLIIIVNWISLSPCRFSPHGGEPDSTEVRKFK